MYKIKRLEINKLNCLENKILEKALDEIVKVLKKSKLKLSKNLGDKRLNSAKNEDEIIEVILKEIKEIEYFEKNNLTILSFNAVSDNNRAWFDFAIVSKDIKKHNYFMPINIKVSELNKADNLNCKLGIFYALTGCRPEDISLNNECNWTHFFKQLKLHIGKNKHKDYYFLVVNKNDTSDIFWTSLKRLNKLTPNGNNLPFQCKWNNNRTFIDRNYNEARSFIITNLNKSIELREKIGLSFKKYLGKYIKSEEDEK